MSSCLPDNRAGSEYFQHILIATPKLLKQKLLHIGYFFFNHQNMAKNQQPFYCLSIVRSLKQSLFFIFQNVLIF